MLVSSTEPPPMKVLGTSSQAPEKYGVDVMWASAKLGGVVGVQRKEISDFVASLQDGRLSKEIVQMQALTQGVLMIEGRLRWSTEGELMSDKWTKWNRSAHRNVCRSFMAKGIWVEHTDDISDTVATILGLERYFEKERHDSLLRRPKPRGNWGVATDRDWACHLLQSIDGIGPGQAEKILDHFGKVPMGWTVELKDLMGVPGIGKVKAERMWRALQQAEEEVPNDAPR